MLGDLNIAEPKALIGFAGPRVIEQTISRSCPRVSSAASSCSRRGSSTPSSTGASSYDARPDDPADAQCAGSAARRHDDRVAPAAEVIAERLAEPTPAAES
jgi:hypothetical protein